MLLHGAQLWVVIIGSSVILRSEATKNPSPGFTRGTDPSASPQDDSTRVVTKWYTDHLFFAALVSGLLFDIRSLGFGV